MRSGAVEREVEAAVRSAVPEPVASAGTPAGRRPLRPDPLWRLGVLLLALGGAALLGWEWYADRVAAAFREARDRAPSHIYAPPLALRPGAPADPEGVGAHLSMAGYTEAERVEAPGQYRLEGRRWWIHRRAHRVGTRLRPERRLIVTLDESGAVASVRRPWGARLPSAWLEPPHLRPVDGPEASTRIPVALEEIPAHLTAAVLAIEDHRFHAHHGLDLRRVAGALWENVRAGRAKEGGSTITQQLVRTLFLGRERTLARKAREALLALALERRTAKEEILDAYLNHVYFGHRDGRAIHGVGRAARAWFGKDVTALRLEESALLAGLVRAPQLYAPHRDPAAARARRDLVLRIMRSRGAAPEASIARALATPVRVAPEEARPRPAPWFADFAAREVRAREVGTRAPGRTVIATLAPELQRVAEEAVDRGLRELERAYPYQVADGPAPLQAALVALDPTTGDILAMVGGRNYGASQFNRAVDARRQPGSAFKPVVALAALAGVGFAEPRSLSSPLRDAPLRVATDEGPWQPGNIDGLFLGTVSLARALELSRNVPFARLGMELGPGRIAATARALGIRSELHAVPSLALGSSEVSLLELTAAYAVFAAEGVRAEPRAVREIRGPEGALEARPAPARVRAFPRESVRLLHAALEGVVRRGTGSGVRARGYRGPVAAKSGTSDEYRDAWFIGYTPELAVGVWVGFDDGRSLGLPANVVALPIFVDFLRRASR